MPRPASSLIATFLGLYDELSRHLRRRTGSAERAEDVLQDTYLRLRETESRHSHEVLDGRAYIYRVAGNLAVDTARRERRGGGSEGEPTEALVDPQPGPEHRAEAQGRLQRLDAALAELPANVRMSLLLFRVDGLSHAQIARRLGVSESMVAKYLARALRHCRDRLEPC